MPSCCRQPCCAAQSNTGVAGGGRRALCDCWLVTRSAGQQKQKGGRNLRLAIPMLQCFALRIERAPLAGWRRRWVQVGGASADRLVFEGPLVVYATASDVECPGDGRGGAGSAGGRGGSSAGLEQVQERPRSFSGQLWSGGAASGEVGAGGPGTLRRSVGPAVIWAAGHEPEEEREQKATMRPMPARRAATWTRAYGVFGSLARRA
ncbi:hypothetical protein COCCADRAFT_27430 [Bipolaris zeicola 26-R-13]|uniref:Uncharacterized protein n=1 Tax=Cochliobolus carbonum (strain 26-R-13) TaxID=930089 RepID=W6Y981_COCC2|nr:uncharacterized protein COCCADRAFT_27430 [Bipolaris zeicola 26-R-13]EUC31944.1 hypothetical protein COCCADRAFT_27430 [Bipolaris zeicola 26-R-13]